MSSLPLIRLWFVYRTEGFYHDLLIGDHDLGRIVLLIAVWEKIAFTAHTSLSLSLSPTLHLFRTLCWVRERSSGSLGVIRYSSAILAENSGQGLICSWKMATEHCNAVDA